MRKIWPFTFNVLWFASMAFVLPFIVLFYQELGFTGTQIGVLTGITPLISMIGAPLWTRLADATGKHRLIVSFLIAIGMIVLFLYPTLTSFGVLLLAIIIINGFLAPIQSFADSATMFMLADEKDMYGRVRLGATIGFGIAAFISGIFVENHGLKFAFWGSAILLLMTFMVSQKFKFQRSEASEQNEGSVRKILMEPQWILFLTLAFGAGLSMAAANNYFYPFLKELGASESMMGFAITVGTIAEIPILFFGNHFIKRFKPYGFLIFAMVISSIRFFLFAVAETPQFILIVQLLNGLTFASIWVAGVTYVNENAPEGLSTTAQGLFGAMVTGFGNAVGGFVGGLLLESIGGRVLFLGFGIVILVIVAIVSLIQKIRVRQKLRIVKF
jgi:PPP family 3-phenylpropionic acid transporter